MYLRMSLLVVAALALVSLAAPSGVSAHADYERSEPAQDEVLSEPPVRVDVWFTQGVFKREGDNFVRVFDEQETQVSDGDGVVDDDDRTHMHANLTEDVADGRYIVRWKTTSDEDGDTDEGEFCFYVGVEPTAEQAAECAEISALEPTLTLVSTAPADEATATPVDSPDGSDDGGGSGAAIAGVIVGVVVVVAIAGAFVLWMRRTPA